MGGKETSILILDSTHMGLSNPDKAVCPSLELRPERFYIAETNTKKRIFSKYILNIDN